MTINKNNGLSNFSIIIIVSIVLIATIAATVGSQYLLEKPLQTSSKVLTEKKTEYQISKLDAEIDRIRSETSGSNFWLKLIALFVTVGGAIGGYLIGQSRTTQEKLAFENRKNVDEVYQSIVQELACESPILRASSAVKLGAILKSFPSEWTVSEARKEQLHQLTKQVLAAALSIESDKKVLKTLSINLVLHKLHSSDELSSVKELDLSAANAIDAYWARCNFEYTDFYLADLTRASFRKSNLSGAQFRETILKNTIFEDSVCIGTNFKMADLRGASFKGAELENVNFEGAKVYSVELPEAHLEKLPDYYVDVSERGDGSDMILVNDWLSRGRNS
jgi:hypothetical protein